MIPFKDGCSFLIEDVRELPDFTGAKTLYCDLETTSGDSKLDSLNPHHHCSTALIAITVDDHPKCYAIPFMHLSEPDKDIAQQWLGGIAYTVDEWINQNVKYDAHVFANDLGLEPPCKLICSLTQAKMIDSDRIVRGGYGLDALLRDWLGEDLSEYYNSLKPYLYRVTKAGKQIQYNQDYGRIPAYTLGAYACAQVTGNRRLQHWINANMPAQCYYVRDNEIELTRNLFNMERNGLRIDRKQIMTKQFFTLNKMMEIDRELTKLVGFQFRPHVSEDLRDVLLVKYGLPIVAYTKDQKTGEFTENPSFDKHALAQYETIPGAPRQVIKLIREYKHLEQLNNLFLKPWQELAVETERGTMLRSSYNQAVRTGRMAANQPNATQLSPEAKSLVIPEDGHAFISLDYSQIEFRFIAHYINDEKILRTFAENPDADFHEMIADWCGIHRKPAKAVNFGIAFGEGKKKLIKQLSTNPELVAKITEYVESLVESGQLAENLKQEVFTQLATKKAISVFDAYHSTLAPLKPTMKAAEYALLGKGYVFNMYGRHRHLPREFAYRAFNTVNQSSAADMFKERINALLREIFGLPITLRAAVHDEILLHAPIDVAYHPATIRDIACFMENIPIKINVPVRCSIGLSTKSWKDAGDDMQQPFVYTKHLLRDRKLTDYSGFAHLRA